MASSLDFIIREKLLAYLAREISLDTFEDWFFSETWDIDQLDDFLLTNLVYGIKLRLAEFSNGDWTEAELQHLLRPFVEKHDMVVAPIPSQVKVQFGTSSVTESVSVYSAQLINVSIINSLP